MTPQFKKFLIGLASVFLGFLTLKLLIFGYMNLDYVKKGDTFGGEAILIYPLALASIFFYYYQLKKFGEYKWVRPAGIEPATISLKGSCSTD